MYVRHFFKCSFLLLFVAFSLLTCSFFFFWFIFLLLHFWCTFDVRNSDFFFPRF